MDEFAICKLSKRCCSSRKNKYNLGKIYTFVCGAFSELKEKDIS